MNKKRWLSIICGALFVAVLYLCIWLLSRINVSIGQDMDFNTETLRWTMIGAIGSWIGSIFGAVALVISLLLCGCRRE